MFFPLLISCAVASQQSVEMPALGVGQPIGGEIVDGDHVVETDELTALYRQAPTVGRRFLIGVEESGVYHIDLRSYFFDAYIVLRDGEGKVVAEDDDGGIGLHARIVAELAPEVSYFLEACALHGQRGAFELSLTEGRPTELDARERARADLDDAERRLQDQRAPGGRPHCGYDW